MVVCSMPTVVFHICIYPHHHHHPYSNNNITETVYDLWNTNKSFSMSKPFIIWFWLGCCCCCCYYYYIVRKTRHNVTWLGSIILFYILLNRRRRGFCWNGCMSDIWSSCIRRCYYYTTIWLIMIFFKNIDGGNYNTQVTSL